MPYKCKSCGHQLSEVEKRHGDVGVGRHYFCDRCRPFEVERLEKLKSKLKDKQWKKRRREKGKFE